MDARLLPRGQVRVTAPPYRPPRLLAVKDITPLEGGLPVMLDGKIIGSIGVSGALSSQDAQVARVGAAAVVK